MVWRAKLPISDEIRNNFSPLIYIFRFFGIFPLTMKRTSVGVFLTWSPWLAAYSYFLGFLIIVVSGYDDITQSLSKKTAYFDRLVTLFPQVGYCTSTFFGVFVMASKTSQIFKYFNCINQADLVINTTCSNFDKYKMLLLPIIVFLNSEIIHFIKGYTFKLLTGDKIHVIKAVVTKDIPFLMNIYISLMLEYFVRLMAYNLELRFVQLNQILQKHVIKMRVEEAKMKTDLNIIEVRERISSKHESSNFIAERDAVLRLNKVYLTLIQAVKMVNDLFGLNILVVITATFFDLISTSYSLIFMLEEKSPSNLRLITQLIIFSFNVFRILVITEPLYGCTVKIKTIAVEVSYMLSLNLDRLYKQQVRIFAESIHLTQPQFSACELFTVDRVLISTIVGGVINYVVILMGMKKSYLSLH